MRRWVGGREGGGVSEQGPSLSGLDEIAVREPDMFPSSGSRVEKTASHTGGNKEVPEITCFL